MPDPATDTPDLTVILGGRVIDPANNVDAVRDVLPARRPD